MMAKPNAYTVSLPQEKQGALEEGVSQSSPAWVLTFMRWAIQDPLRTPVSQPQEIREPLVVENDCIDVTVSSNKGSLTPNVTATLKITDVNYASAVHPGDFCFVNMLNWETEGKTIRGSRDIVRKANAIQPINEIEDGFKGFFKVQSVRKTVQTVAETGTKILVVKIDGFAFTEFNNTIYFNPNLVNQKDLDNNAIFVSNISAGWASQTTMVVNKPLQDILAFLIQNLIGATFNPLAKNPAGLVSSPNEQFLIPQGVGRLLGVVNDRKFNSENYRTKTVSVKDVYKYLFGIQLFSGALDGNATTMAHGLNPSNIKAKDEYGNFIYTETVCGGKAVLKAEYWNQVKMWSILNQYTNSPLNELYTCFKVDLNGRVMPHVVFRQIPFTSTDFERRTLSLKDSSASSIPITKYLTLPRWKIEPAIVQNFDLGTDEAARINFVQYYAKSNISDKGVDISAETALKNYVYDKDDIRRNGLRPYIIQNQFSDLTNATAYEGPIWARVIGDAVIGGHLKVNGTLVCKGIVEPISVGENVEFDGVVYHIEQVTHQCAMNQATGDKTFRTILSLSHGVSANSDEVGTKYANMAHVGGDGQRNADWNNNQILPGVSESQDSAKRADHNTIDVNHSFDPKQDNGDYPQPSMTKNKPRTGE